jgi:prolipoprotein diacylglyceryltransferase
MKNLIAVGLGLAAVALSGLILYPLVFLAFDKFFHIFEKGNPGDDFFLAATLILWAMISAFVGGWVASRLAVNKPLQMAAITGGVTTIILLLLFCLSQKSSVEWALVIYCFIPVVFAYLGGRTGNYFLKKKNATKHSDDLNV